MAAGQLEPGWRARSCTRARRSACYWRRSTTCGGRCGAGAVFEDTGLERRFRDVHVATQHVALAPRTLEIAARVALGLDPRGIF